jgi:hypothetical protein
MQCIAVVAVFRVRDDGIRHLRSGLTTGQVLLVVVGVMCMQLSDVTPVK